MLTRIEALNYRCLRYIAQELVPFEVMVGPNGSGKSTFLDVIAFAGDLLRVGPLRAMLGDSANQVPPRASDPQDLTWMRQSRSFELVIELAIPPSLRSGRYESARYELEVEVASDDGGVHLTHETLWLTPRRDDRQSGSLTLFPHPITAPQRLRQSKRAWRKVVTKTESGNDYFRGEDSGWNNQFRLGPDRSALANLPEDESKFPIAIWVRNTLLQGVQRVVLSAEDLRRSSPPGSPTSFLPDGSNLPWVVHHLRGSDPSRFRQWVEHVRTALPEVRDVDTVERPEDRHRYLLLEYGNGLRAPSWVISDGTLRLLALTLLAYLPVRDAIYLIEEPENGIHPLAVETVMEALSNVYDSQVLCASHSPVVLSTAGLDQILCFGQDADGATDVVQGSEHPRLRAWQAGSDVGTLFASGVLGPMTPGSAGRASA